MKKIIIIFIISILFAALGSGVAYYNTASLGYDNANLISFYEDGIYVLDFDINYNKTKNEIKRLRSCFPEKLITI